MNLEVMLKTVYKEKKGRRYIVRSLLAPFVGSGKTLQEALLDFFLRFKAFSWATERAKPKNSGYVEPVSIVMAEVGLETKRQLHQLGVRYGLTQGEVIELLWANYSAFAPDFFDESEFDEVARRASDRLVPQEDKNGPQSEMGTS